MKKLFAMILVLVFALTATAAFAAQIAPLPGTNMEDNLDNCTLRIGFKLDAVTEKEIMAEVYTEQRYDAVEVSQIAVGDVINYMGEDVTVETVEVDYSTLINGGSLEGDGITLCPDEGGTYIALEGESVGYLLLGFAQLTFADEVTYRHWQQDEEGGIMDEMSSETVPAAEIKNVLAAEGEEAFWPDSLTVVIENGFVTELNINYVP